MPTLEKLIELSRVKLTPEQRQKQFDEFNSRMRQRDKDDIERRRCGICGADTINYSHTFDCPRRGSGF